MTPTSSATRTTSTTTVLPGWSAASRTAVPSASARSPARGPAREAGAGRIREVARPPGVAAGPLQVREAGPGVDPIPARVAGRAQGAVRALARRVPSAAANTAARPSGIPRANATRRALAVSQRSALPTRTVPPTAAARPEPAPPRSRSAPSDKSADAQKARPPPWRSRRWMHACNPNCAGLHCLTVARCSVAERDAEATSRTDSRSRPHGLHWMILHRNPRNHPFRG